MSKMSKAIDAIHTLTEMLGPMAEDNTHLRQRVEDQHAMIMQNAEKVRDLRCELNAATKAADDRQTDLTLAFAQLKAAKEESTKAAAECFKMLDLLRAIGQNKGLSPRLHTELVDLLKEHGIMLKATE